MPAAAAPMKILRLIYFTAILFLPHWRLLSDSAGREPRGTSHLTHLRKLQHPSPYHTKCTIFALLPLAVRSGGWIRLIKKNCIMFILFSITFLLESNLIWNLFLLKEPRSVRAIHECCHHFWQAIWKWQSVLFLSFLLTKYSRISYVQSTCWLYVELGTTKNNITIHTNNGL